MTPARTASTRTASGELDDVDIRALTQYMTVLEDTGRVRGADDLFLVVSQSGGSTSSTTATAYASVPTTGTGNDGASTFVAWTSRRAPGRYPPWVSVSTSTRRWAST